MWPFKKKQKIVIEKPKRTTVSIIKKVILEDNITNKQYIYDSLNKYGLYVHFEITNKILMRTIIKQRNEYHFEDDADEYCYTIARIEGQNISILKVDWENNPI